MSTNQEECHRRDIKEEEVIASYLGEKEDWTEAWKTGGDFPGTRSSLEKSTPAKGICMKQRP